MVIKFGQLFWNSKALCLGEKSVRGGRRVVRCWRQKEREKSSVLFSEKFLRVPKTDPWTSVSQTIHVRQSYTDRVHTIVSVIDDRNSSCKFSLTTKQISYFSGIGWKVQNVKISRISRLDTTGRKEVPRISILDIVAKGLSKLNTGSSF